MDDVLKLPLERTLLIKEADVWPWEMIFRHHVGGSVWKQYQTDSTAGGNQIPAGLSKWQKLDSPIFTPTTKAESGHDVAVTVADYAQETGDFGMMLSQICGDIYARAYEYAARRNLLVLDTKFEVSPDGEFLDEVLTPDSSRYTTVEDLESAIAEGRDPVFYDKEPVRIWGRALETPWGTGLQSLDPNDDSHLDFVEELEVPAAVADDCSDRYLQIFEMITGYQLVDYQGTVPGHQLTPTITQSWGRVSGPTFFFQKLSSIIIKEVQISFLLIGEDNGKTSNQTFCSMVF